MRIRPAPTQILASSALLYSTKRFGDGKTSIVRMGVAHTSTSWATRTFREALFLRNPSGHRNRLFDVYGAQSNVGLQHAHGQLDLGVRYIHQKAHDRRINGDEFNAKTGAIRDEELGYGRALSGYVQYRFLLGSRISLAPSVRFVPFNQERHSRCKRVSGVPTNVGIRKDNGVTAAIPGVGFSVRAHMEVTFFSGMHRGFAPPSTKVAITGCGEDLDLEAERSWNYEAGVRLAR